MFLFLPALPLKPVLSQVSNHSEEFDVFQDRITVLNGAPWIAGGGGECPALAPTGEIPYKLHIAAGLSFSWQGNYCHCSININCN